jgi:hypothetical protein
MGALKEYHWDAKGNTYGNLLIRIGEGDYIGGNTFMDHGRACFLLLKHEAAVWTTYDGHGFLCVDTSAKKEASSAREFFFCGSE